MLRIKMVKSPIGQTKHNRAVITALGLRKTNQTVVHKDTPSIRGMVHHVKHMLVVEEFEAAPVAEAKPAKAKKAPAKESKE